MVTPTSDMEQYSVVQCSVVSPGCHARVTASQRVTVVCNVVVPNTCCCVIVSCSGCWRLVYTTSDSILGSTRSRPFKPDYTRILQSIDAEKLLARNEEWVLGGVGEQEGVHRGRSPGEGAEGAGAVEAHLRREAEEG